MIKWLVITNLIGALIAFVAYCAKEIRGMSRTAAECAEEMEKFKAMILAEKNRLKRLEPPDGGNGDD